MNLVGEANESVAVSQERNSGHVTSNAPVGNADVHPRVTCRSHLVIIRPEFIKDWAFLEILGYRACTMVMEFGG
jgi:hypothetical protein